MANNEKFSRSAATVLLFVMIAAFVLAVFGVFSGDNSTGSNKEPSTSSSSDETESIDIELNEDNFIF